MKKGKPTYNDFVSAKPAELMKTYKLDQRGLENAHRDIMYGARSEEMRGQYDRFYRRNRKDA
jgi:hypothetical protein